MSIAAGISATKTGFDLIRSLREAIGRPDVNPGEVQARLVELQSLMLDAQKALGDSEEENRTLSAQLAAKEHLEEIEADLEFATDGRFWTRKSEKDKALIPYCPVCWGKEKQLVVMGACWWPGVYKCSVHDGVYTTQVYNDWLAKQKQSTNETSQRRGRDGWMG
ncbi:MAG: hypothetical protein ABSD56_07760 [Bryobacteraceae bacterium]